MSYTLQKTSIVPDKTCRTFYLPSSNQKQSDGGICTDARETFVPRAFLLLVRRQKISAEKTNVIIIAQVTAELNNLSASQNTHTPIVVAYYFVEARTFLVSFLENVEK